MSREAAVEDLYQELTTFVRRSRELGHDLHPGLSLVAYTFLSLIDATPEVRASDLAAKLGLDKSTVSRQLDQLLDSGLIRRQGGRPGRRGDPLSLTRAGRRRLASAADRVRLRLALWLEGWEADEIETFAGMVGRFNAAIE